MSAHLCRDLARLLDACHGDHVCSVSDLDRLTPGFGYHPVLFEQYRRQLIAEKLPPYLATGFQLVLGNGYQRFGDFAKARSHLELTMTLAKQYDLNQFLFQAEEALFAIEQPAPPSHVAENMPLDVEEVAQAIREMRESVGVG